jgi:lipopolysaccharide/colanic/teichoic acid biosynthesis glycosyltransferase
VRSRLLKRALDVTGAAVALAVGAPVLAGVAALVWYDVGRPVLFRQKRPGRDGVPFDCVKFRTMRDAVDATGRPLPDGERLTKIGAWLRATSLDELPELWCVLRGDMSLVGPRPLLMKYLDRYSPEQRRRHDVKPGITGWAQVNGRNASDWETKFALDLWYVDHWSLAVDLRILARTVGAVLRRDGITHPGDATMPEFTGSAATGAR